MKRLKLCLAIKVGYDLMSLAFSTGLRREFQPIPSGYMASNDKNEFIIFVCIYLIDNLLIAFLSATGLEQVCKSL